jgi:hypothetical protein
VTTQSVTEWRDRTQDPRHALHAAQSDLLAALAALSTGLTTVQQRQLYSYAAVCVEQLVPLVERQNQAIRRWGPCNTS